MAQLLSFLPKTMQSESVSEGPPPAGIKQTSRNTRTWHTNKLMYMHTPTTHIHTANKLIHTHTHTHTHTHPHCEQLQQAHAYTTHTHTHTHNANKLIHNMHIHTYNTNKPVQPNTHTRM